MPWVLGLPEGPPEKDSLESIVDADGGMDEAENQYYEAAADPQFVQNERDQRRYRGAFVRRVRRLAAQPTARERDGKRLSR